MRLLFALFLGTAPLASAQQSEVFIQQAEQALGSPVEALAGTGAAGLALSNAVLEAGTSANVAVVSQEGSDNEVDLTQDGTGNQFSLFVVGQENDLFLIQQGNGNTFTGEIRGDGNVLAGPGALSEGSIQEGGGNTYNLVLEGVNDTSHMLRQLGGNNTASQTVGVGMVPASIEQFGNATVSVVRR